MANLTRLSRFLSLMLRHKAEQFGLVLDEEGFARLDAVWERVEKRYGDRYTRADLTRLIDDSPAGGRRFELKAGRIRALYGHSAVPEVRYPRAIPPEILYHGTTPAALGSIRQEGLTSRQRQYVHLSTSVERASQVAGRRGKPVILRIRALDAHRAGYIFHHPEARHYLVKSVPPEFIDLDGEPDDIPK